jgi:prepilin peptidase CpaA
MSHYFAPVSLFAFVAIAAILDLRTKRIPNWLNAAAVLLAVLISVVDSGAHGLAASGAGLLTGGLLFLPFYVAGGFGAGDVKAMGAVGAFLGPRGALITAAWILVAGGLCAVVVLAARRWRRSSRDEGRPATAGTEPFPYGVAIALGTVLSLGWG